jgi:sugar phosphate isomerase/epimerase
VTVGALFVAGCATPGATAGTRPAAENAVPVLAVRLANYGPYEEAGWEHLGSIGIKHVFITVPAPDQVDATKEKLAKYGMDAPVMKGVTDLSKEASVSELGKQLEVCGQMKVKYMFLSAKCKGAPATVVCDRIHRAGDIARVHGVTIVLETHPELGTNADVHRETMLAINHPNVRVNFDTGNITYYNHGLSAVTELGKIIDLVATVEIKDHNGQFEVWNFPPLGKGVVDIAGILRVLKEHKYAGPITMEIEGVQGVERSEAQIKKDIADSVAYMRSIGSFR